MAAGSDASESAGEATAAKGGGLSPEIGVAGGIADKLDKLDKISQPAWKRKFGPLLKRIVVFIDDGVDRGVDFAMYGMKLMGPCFVLLAVTLISFVSYTYFYFVVWQIPIGALGQLSISSIGVFFLLNALWNYWMTARSDAGRPLSKEESESLVEEEAGVAKPALRICNKCNFTKPIRAHHCSICNRCVLKMDHHCPWMNNCVGQGNYRHFILFLFFLAESCGFFCFVCAFFLDDDGNGLSSDAQQSVAVAFMISASILIALGVLGGFHLYLMITNQTTLEFYGNLAARAMARKNKQRWANPYCKGYGGNFREVFGYPFWNSRWLFPWVALLEAWWTRSRAASAAGAAAREL